MASDSEDDYMSDAILQQCEDKRPGLVSSRIAKIYQKDVKHKQKNSENTVKPKKVLEAEKRDQGLKLAIGSENKGFALLSKMGYKPGMSLGKKGEGRSDPVPIEIRAGRSGLGRDSELKRRAESVNAARKDALKKRLKLDSQRKDKFLQRMSEKYTGQQTDRDLVKSQKVCLQLDQQQEIEHPVRKFYWPKNSLPKETQSQEIDDFDDDFDDDGPPSISRQRKDEEEEDDVEEEEELDEDDDICGVDKLQMLTQYLREQYFYCVWCGTRYDDADDLESNCPGDTSEDHDD